MMFFQRREGKKSSWYLCVLFGFGDRKTIIEQLRAALGRVDPNFYQDQDILRLARLVTARKDVRMERIGPLEVLKHN